VDFSDGEACLDEIALIVSVCLSVFLSPPPFSPFIYLVALV